MRYLIPDEPGCSHSISTPGGGFCVVFEPARKKAEVLKPRVVDPKKPKRHIRPVIDLLRRRYRIQAP